MPDLTEDMQSKLDTVIEMLSDNLNVKTSVSEHEARLQKLEADSDMVKSTVALHSRQLASSAR